MTTPRIEDFGIRPPVTEPPTRPPAPPAAGAPTFGEALESALRGVDQGLVAADAQATAYVAGANVDLHNVIIDLQRADLNLRTMVQVRNKLLEAYKEVMRIPV